MLSRSGRRHEVPPACDETIPLLIGAIDPRGCFLEGDGMFAPYCLDAVFTRRHHANPKRRGRGENCWFPCTYDVSLPRCRQANPKRSGAGQNCRCPAPYDDALPVGGQGEHRFNQLPKVRDAVDFGYGKEARQTLAQPAFLSLIDTLKQGPADTRSEE